MKLDKEGRFYNIKLRTLNSDGSTNLEAKKREIKRN